MKLTKKLTAVVATVALCCSVIVPVSVKAANACPHVYTVETTMSRMQMIAAEYGEHTYEYPVVLPDGTLGEPIRKTCQVQLARCFYDAVCYKCGDVVEDYTHQDKEWHKHCGKAFVYDYE